MKKIFENYETFRAFFFIILYIVINSFCLENFGLTDYRSFICLLVFSLLIVGFIVQLKLVNYYGLKTFPKAKEFLYFIPLLLISSVNLWTGININNTVHEIIFYILAMCCVGFLEEIIFRGFLFKMMEKDNVNVAIIVSSVTFGIGHIVNLFNGAEIIPTLLQICYAISAGFMFVTIFQKGKSLWPCIICHALINSLSIFSIDNFVSRYIASIFLIIVPIIYTFYLRKIIK